MDKSAVLKGVTIFFSELLECVKNAMALIFLFFIVKGVSMTTREEWPIEIIIFSALVLISVIIVSAHTAYQAYKEIKKDQ